MSDDVPKAIRAGNYCPECGSFGSWRSGVGFEHEKICMSPACRAAGGSTVWEPGEEYIPKGKPTEKEAAPVSQIPTLSESSNVQGLGQIRCVVSCVQADGTPSFFPCVIQCTQEDYSEGNHYDLAKDQALDNGYEQCGVVYDEHDGPEFLFQAFSWKWSNEMSPEAKIELERLRAEMEAGRAEDGGIWSEYTGPGQ